MTPPPAHHRRTISFDIFCRVIDNYGDIGVCWRLARQLAQAPFGHNVRLWVDDLDSFKRLEPFVCTESVQQQIQGVDIVHWHAGAPVLTPHEVVIEAFACAVPQPFIDAMVKRNSLWLNLEYLSAEPWVDGFHLQPSIQSNGLRKFFFFPGFTPETGGLLREPTLLEQRRRWQTHPDLRRAFLHKCGLSQEDLAALDNGARLIFVFCYPDAPLTTLTESLARHDRPTLVLIPEGIYPLPQSEGQTSGQFPGQPADQRSPHTRTSRQTCSHDRVHIRPIPFVSQTDFDLLLWSADLNIVRGEDSLVRALWAARPMIWQPYRQDDDMHVTKLEAWLARSPLHTDTKALIRSWNLADLPQLNTQLDAHLQPATWERWTAQSKQWSDQLSTHADLATALAGFCTQQL